MSFGTKASFSTSHVLEKHTLLLLTIIKVDEETVLEEPVELGIEHERTRDWVAYDFACASIL